MYIALSGSLSADLDVVGITNCTAGRDRRPDLIVNDLTFFKCVIFLFLLVSLLTYILIVIDHKL